MCRDYEIWQQTLWRTSAGAAPADGISGEARSREHPDILFKVEINSDGRFRKSVANKSHIQAGNRR
jgi:hypothetical protein